MKNYLKSNYIYTALFCEENIWHLSQSLIKEKIDAKNISVLFLTNTDKQIAIFNQLTGKINEPVVWDYHVILKANLYSKKVIFDFDSRLEFPCSYNKYINQSLPDNIHPKYKSKITEISSQEYIKRFESDRSHMKGVIPLSQFPNYPPITSTAVKDKIRLFDLIN